MIEFRRAVVCSLMLLVPSAAALAQVPTDSGPKPPVADPAGPRRTAGQWLADKLWIVGGGGYASARAGCDICDPAGVYHESASITIIGGVHATPRIDAGIETHWVNLKLDDSESDPVRTTFILATAQIKPWLEHGFFLRTGLGLSIVGRGLWSPIANLEPPYTTNALGFVYGAGWTFKVKDRWALQAHATHYIASLGEITMVDGTTLKNMIGNYWTVGLAIVVR